MITNRMVSAEKALIFRVLSVLFLLPLVLWAQSFAQENAQFAPQDNRLLVFIDYSESDNTERFIRSEIHFVDYVRDPNLAQVHVFITEQKTGSQGKQHP